MLVGSTVNDKIQIISSVVADLRVLLDVIVISTATPPVVQGGSFGADPLPAITVTTPVDVVVGAAGVTKRVMNGSIRNAHASAAPEVTVRRTDGTDNMDMKAMLLPGESLVYINGAWVHYNHDIVPKSAAPAHLFNASTVAQGPGFATDTYATGSFIVLPSLPKVGTKYVCRIAISKTAGGTATPIVQVRVGAAGSTADTSRNSFTFSVGTAATDTGVFEIEVVFRSVGAGTSAVLQGFCSLVSQPTTGLSSLIHAVMTTSGGFDSTVSGIGIGVSVNGGASAAWTVQQVTAVLNNV